ncbi:MAG TPA: hypothetical protein VFT78_06950 [Hanamia sp.]|nr:hypothetical protein [Hanamia sp.]
MSSISHINRQMMYVHAFFIAFIVFLMGLLCLISSNELITTTFGKRIALGLGIFWLTAYWCNSLVTHRFFGKERVLKQPFTFCLRGFGYT